MKKTIYLSGRVNGLTYNEAMTWRKQLKNKLITDFNCYMPEYQTDVSQNEIWDHNYYMIDKSDILVVNFDYDNTIPFLGTSIEIGRAYYQRKPIIIYSTKDWVKNNFTLKYHSTKIIDSMDDLIEYLQLYK